MVRVVLISCFVCLLGAAAFAQQPQAPPPEPAPANPFGNLSGQQARWEQVDLAMEALFGRGELSQLDESTLAAALREASVAELKPGLPDTITELLVASGLSKSKGEARRTIGEGGAYVNNARIDTEDWAPQPSDFLYGRWLVLRRGKRNIAGVERVE